ncbi:MAG: zf-TFIIB domain-containing protein [Nitrospirae bacterium]|nr:zf-TFIIB domain-containing protein [Nitrospirota bacterium]
MNDTKKCEHCGREINAVYSVCPLCGGNTEDIIEPNSPICPRCRTPLHTETGHGEKYEICQSCGGMWLDRSDFHCATTEYNVFKNDDFKNEYKREPMKDPVEYIPCVRCSKLMIRKNFRHISGVMIDVCGRHGVWLDKGELQRIRHFIADGGLQSAQDKEIENNRVKIEEVASDVEQTAFVQKMLHFWNFKRWLFGG